ncbi:MAG: hypothetical protein M0R30_09035 [Methanoregula sp.]|uniref:hypothetical protein n=1 Tax=Methanoregula sp. TaxID=2052170 RepID=UPI0025DF8188|nr:hypothetical protein [Methanoregula sp.]MCK9631777.1 hypothetical protein [Methanoregula sp.]
MKSIPEDSDVEQDSAFGISSLAAVLHKSSEVPESDGFWEACAANPPIFLIESGMSREARFEILLLQFACCSFQNFKTGHFSCGVCPFIGELCNTASLAVTTDIPDLATEHDHYLYGLPKRGVHEN